MQVERLIREAISTVNLCQSYIGWCPFWVGAAPAGMLGVQCIATQRAWATGFQHLGSMPGHRGLLHSQLLMRSLLCMLCSDTQLMMQRAPQCAWLRADTQPLASNGVSRGGQAAGCNNGDGRPMWALDSCNSPPECRAVHHRSMAGALCLKKCSLSQ